MDSILNLSPGVNTIFGKHWNLMILMTGTPSNVTFYYFSGEVKMLQKILGTQISYKTGYASWEIKNMLLAHSLLE